MKARAVPAAIEANGIYTMHDVAALVFRHSYRWFFENRQRLTNDEGFPRPISKFGFPRWNGSDLLEWMARPKAAPEPLTHAPRPGNIHQLSALLKDRSAALLAGKKR